MLPVIALGVFAVAALFGAFLAFKHFTGARLPTPVALLHGLFAASGIVVLLLAYMQDALPSMAKIALGLFVVAALGGFVLFAHHLKRKKLPSPVVLIHAGVAVTAFLILGVSIL
ncbi:MAG: hypothetical protein R3D66_02140 [Alphaproteobacteria bacterium]